MVTEKRILLILIADDDPDDQLLIREAFEERCKNCQLCFVSNGVELMTLLKGESAQELPERCPVPDLILLDLNMPLKDGRQALTEIRSDPALRQLPTVILTTSKNDEDVNFCQSRGANDYIVKPNSYSELLAIVESLKTYWENNNREPTPESDNND